jgi:nucleotide-binding universal stress UspA family protein
MRRAATAAKLREATQRETRMRITRIIVPVDGSEPAKRAIALAAGLAAPAGAACVLVHVRTRFGADIVPEELVSLEHAEHLRITEESMLAAASERILSDAEALARAAGAARIEKVTEFGDPATRILEVAARDGGPGSMIAMGRRGLGRIGRLLMGSVSTKVAQLATQPCLVVP